MADEVSDKQDWDSKEWRPNPDPTRLTTSQLELAIGTLRRELGTAIDTLRRESSLQFQNYDQALKLLASRADREPSASQVQSNVEHSNRMSEVRHDTLKELLLETHNAFKVLVEQTNTHNATAMANAEASHEKAIGKAETASTTQILDVKSRLDLVAKNLEQKIDGIDTTVQRLNDRVTGIEARGTGLSESRGWASQQTTHLLSTIAIVVSLASVVLYLITMMARPVPTTFQQAPSYGTQNVNPPSK